MGAAERLYRAGLALAERRLPSDDPLTARLRNDLAVFLKYTGHFEEARRLYMRSLAVLIARRPLSHPDIATLLHNLGGLHHAAGDPAAGEAPARAALSLRRSIGGADDPAAASDAAALAGILIATDRDDEARDLLESALMVFEARLGREHLEVGTTLAALATIDARSGRLDRAEQRLRRALVIKRRHLGARHLELVPTLGTLGVVCRRQGRPQEARMLYESALSLLAGRVAPSHPHVATLEANLRRLDDPIENGVTAIAQDALER